MKSKNKTILIADDDASHLAMLKTVLESWNLTTLTADNGRNAIESAQKFHTAPAIALLDMRMPEMNGLETMWELKKLWPDISVIVMTAYSEVTDAVEAMRQGATDYLAKPLDLKRLKKLIMGGDSDLPKVCEAQSAPAKEIHLGNSQAMKSVMEIAQAVAPTAATVLVTGPSGTGKEVAAKLVHSLSRRPGPFVGINCGAFSPNLLESELFGYEKGAFTGADKPKSGLFAEAKDGTLFLDEIGEMPLAMQVKLLRVLQEREFLRVGGQKPVPFRGRIIAATNRILEAEIAAGRFREDLYYRLNVVKLELPALRDRVDDIPALARLFAARFAVRDKKPFKGITDEAMKFLTLYSWPGNIRELENVIERAIILMMGEYIEPRLLPEVVKQNPQAAPFARLQSPVQTEVDKAFKPVTLQEMEKEMIFKTLVACGQNKTEAARLLGISRKTLHTKLQSYTENPAVSENGPE